MIDTIIGCDPGKTGGLAVKWKGKYKIYKMPKDITKVDELVKHYKSIGSVLVVIEQIRLHRTEDMARASRMQKLFENFSELKLIMKMNGIHYVEVAPISWQSYLNLRTKEIKKLNPYDRKKAYRDFAERWWPEKISIALGDSVCLNIWGQRKIKFDPDFVATLPESLKLF